MHRRWFAWAVFVPDGSLTERIGSRKLEGEHLEDLLNTRDLCLCVSITGILLSIFDTFIGAIEKTFNCLIGVDVPFVLNSASPDKRTPSHRFLARIKLILEGAPGF